MATMLELSERYLEEAERLKENIACRSRLLPELLPEEQKAMETIFGCCVRCYGRRGRSATPCATTTSRPTGAIASTSAEPKRNSWTAGGRRMRKERKIIWGSAGK